MATLCSVIDIIPSRQFKKFLKTKTISPIIAISVLITTVLLFSTTSIYAEEIENEADNGMSELINSGKELLKQFMYEIDGTKSNTTYIEEKDLNPDTQKLINDAREMLRADNEEIVEKSHEQEPKMTYAEKKAKNDPEYAKLLQHNKELWAKEHPEGDEDKTTHTTKEDEPKDELDALYTDKKYDREKHYSWTDGRIPIIGPWDSNIMNLNSGWLNLYVEENVPEDYASLVGFVIQEWNNKIESVSNGEEFDIVEIDERGDANIIVSYQHGESKDGFGAEVFWEENWSGEMTSAELVIYDSQKIKNQYGSQYYDWLKQGLRHETGHLFGLDHATNEDYLMYYSIGIPEIPISNCEAEAIYIVNFDDRGLDGVDCDM